VATVSVNEQRGKRRTSDPRGTLDWLPTNGVVGVLNDRGMPATATVAIAAHTTAVVLLSSYHVLFARGPGHVPVSLQRGQERRRVATTWYGKLGPVERNFVDCGVATIDVKNGELRADQLDWREELVIGDVVAGAVVTKTGAGSGTTRGVVVHTASGEQAVIDGRPVRAEGQIIVRSEGEGRSFSSLGDSGSLLCDERGRVIGLLWGRNPRGDSVACHIGPVLEVLGVRLARPAVSAKP